MSPLLGLEPHCLRLSQEVAVLVPGDDGLGVALDPAGQVRLLVDARVDPVGLQLNLWRI